MDFEAVLHIVRSAPMEANYGIFKLKNLLFIGVLHVVNKSGLLFELAILDIIFNMVT